MHTRDHYIFCYCPLDDHTSTSQRLFGTNIKDYAEMGLRKLQLRRVGNITPNDERGGSYADLITAVARSMPVEW
jgi:hypothetical protein